MKRPTLMKFDDGYSCHITSVFNIPRKIDRYLTETVVMEVPETDGKFHTLTIYWTGKCDTCGIDYDEASKPQPMFCPDADLNRHFGYVMRICRECYYYIKKSPAPNSVQKRLDIGHTPVLVSSIL